MPPSTPALALSLDTATVALPSRPRAKADRDAFSGLLAPEAAPPPPARAPRPQRTPAVENGPERPLAEDLVGRSRLDEESEDKAAAEPQAPAVAQQAQAAGLAPSVVVATPPSSDPQATGAPVVDAGAAVKPALGATLPALDPAAAAMPPLPGATTSSPGDEASALPEPIDAAPAGTPPAGGTTRLAALALSMPASLDAPSTPQGSGSTAAATNAGAAASVGTQPRTEGEADDVSDGRGKQDDAAGTPSSEAKPSEANPSDVKPSDVKPPDLKASDLKPSPASGDKPADAPASPDGQPRTDQILDQPRPLPEQARPSASVAATAAAPVAMPQVAVTIAARFKAGESRFQIRLDPAELGRIDVDLALDNSGLATTTLTVERMDTLDLLQRDSRALERALGAAGFKTDQGSLQFTLRDPGQNGQGFAQGQGRHQEHGGAGRQFLFVGQSERAGAPLPPTADIYPSRLARLGALDIKV